MWTASNSAGARMSTILTSAPSFSRCATSAGWITGGSPSAVADASTFTDILSSCSARLSRVELPTSPVRAPHALTGECAHDVGPADRAEQAVARHHGNPLEAALEHQGDDLLDRGVLGHAEHIRGHHVGHGLADLADNVRLSDDAHHLAIPVLDRHAADVVERQPLGGVLDEHVSPNGHHVPRHEVGGRSRTVCRSSDRVRGDGIVFSQYDRIHLSPPSGWFATRHYIDGLPVEVTVTLITRTA